MNKFNVSTIEKDFREKISSLIPQYQTSKVAVAFSGGVDSLALLALSEKVFCKELVLPVYVNHKIREESEISKEISLNQENCCKLGLKFYSVELNPNELESLKKEYGTEAAARKLRYNALFAFCEKNECSYVLTAHHKDDQLETVFMKMIKKSPISSLRGISEKKGKLVRPLLEFSKDDLKSYVHSLGLVYSTDSTNSDNKYQRNLVRNVLLPEFKSKYSEAEKKIEEVRELAVSECGDFSWDRDYIELSFFNSLNKAQKYIVLYSMWDRNVGGLLSMKTVERVISRISKTATVESASGGSFCIHHNRLFVISDSALKNSLKTIKKLKNDTEFAGFRCKIYKDQTNLKALHFNVGDLKGDSYLCFPQMGDRIELNGGSKTVLKVLQDMKIPRLLRLITPVVKDDSGVVAIFGSVWGGKDRLALRYRTEKYLERTCVVVTCINK